MPYSVKNFKKCQLNLGKSFISIVSHCFEMSLDQLRILFLFLFSFSSTMFDRNQSLFIQHQNCTKGVYSPIVAFVCSGFTICLCLSVFIRLSEAEMPTAASCHQNYKTSSTGEDVEKREPQCTVGGNADWCSHWGKQNGISLKKLNVEVPFDLAILRLGLYSKNPETPIQKNLCTPMFIAAQFTIAKCQKQSQFP